MRYSGRFLKFALAANLVCMASNGRARDLPQPAEDAPKTGSHFCTGSRGMTAEYRSFSELPAPLQEILNNTSNAEKGKYFEKYKAARNGAELYDALVCDDRATLVKMVEELGSLGFFKRSSETERGLEILSISSRDLKLGVDTKFIEHASDPTIFHKNWWGDKLFHHAKAGEISILNVSAKKEKFPSHIFIIQSGSVTIAQEHFIAEEHFDRKGFFSHAAKDVVPFLIRITPNPMRFEYKMQARSGMDTACQISKPEKPVSHKHNKTGKKIESALHSGLTF
jgi:hypothetical protein